MEKPNAQRAVTPQEEGAASATTTSPSPKKRRKVNHGKKEHPEERDADE